MHEDVEKAYDTVFAEKEADDEFFLELGGAFGAFRKSTSKRPITPSQVKSAQRVLRDRCRTIMKEARDRVRAK